MEQMDTSYIIHHTSYIIHHTSYIIHHTSYIIHHTTHHTHTYDKVSKLHKAQYKHTHIYTHKKIKTPIHSLPNPFSSANRTLNLLMLSLEVGSAYPFEYRKYLCFSLSNTFSTSDNKFNWCFPRCPCPFTM